MINQKKLIVDVQHYAQKITLPSEKATALFRHALVDTISHTVSVRENGEIFVATGDIPAMWLRDSTFQVLPYLSIVEQVPDVTKLIHGVLKQQCSYITHDPYANAFNKEADGQHYSNDTSNVSISPLVWERKFEIDSLCAPLFLAYHLYKKTGYQAHLTADFWQVVTLIMDTFMQEQHHETSPYFFERHNCPPSDTLSNDGRGSEIKYTGMVWSGFRPSDDACQYGYFIPGNQFIVTMIEQLLEILPKKAANQALQEKMQQLRADIVTGIENHGLLKDESGNFYYAYEVDGLGNTLFMDDANVPSLLSLPFLGFCEKEDTIYLNTRKKCLSNLNPYYYEGTCLNGIGSPHTPPDYVWPIALAMEGLTTNHVPTIEEKMALIAKTDANTLQCHEGIDVNDCMNYTREWFSWANMTFCQLVFHYLEIKNA